MKNCDNCKKQFDCTDTPYQCMSTFTPVEYDEPEEMAEFLSTPPEVIFVNLEED